MQNMQPIVSPAKGPFDAKINNWAEGTVMSIDADGGKLSIRGAKRPYASEYAKMLKSIHDKTLKMTDTERAAKAFELRASWNVALDKASRQVAGSDSDFTFHLPSKGEKLVLVDESAFYNRPMTGTASTATLSAAEVDAVRALTDLKVGEWVAVGYASGVLSNVAYAVIKANRTAVH